KLSFLSLRLRLPAASTADAVRWYLPLARTLVPIRPENAIAWAPAARLVRVIVPRSMNRVHALPLRWLLDLATHLPCTVTPESSNVKLIETVAGSERVKRSFVPRGGAGFLALALTAVAFELTANEAWLSASLEIVGGVVSGGAIGWGIGCVWPTMS